MSVLKAAGLPSGNYTTSSVSLSPQYDYSSGAAVLTGQQAGQSLQVTVGGLANSSLLGSLAGSLASIANLTLSGFSFQSRDPSKAYRQARLAAVADAQAKASQYASLSGRLLGSVRKVVDVNQESYTPYVLDANYYAFQAQVLPVPYGTVAVSAYVEVDWNISK